MKRMLRRWKHLTYEEVQAKVDEGTPETYASGGLANGPYKPEYCKELIGRKFDFLFDDFGDIHYEFKDLHELIWKTKKEEHSDYYMGHEFGEGIYFIHHFVKGSNPAEIITLVADTTNGLVTMCHGRLGNEPEPREMAHDFYFGTIAGYDSYPEEKHHFTSDMVGKAIEWTYCEDMQPIKHIYSTEYYYTYVMRGEDSCWVASNPADFVKINDHLYIFSFIEERQAGIQGLFLINTDTLHDVGCFSGINGLNNFECYTVGAKGEWKGMETYLAPGL